MKRMKENKTNKMPYMLGGLLVLAVVVFAAVGIFGGGSAAPEGTESASSPEDSSLQTQDGRIDLGNGLSLVQVGRYSGMYVEDGTDEIVQDILAVTVENTGEQTVQLATVTITDANRQSYSFELTTLPPGEKMAVLEKSRAVFDSNMEIAAAAASGIALFLEEPSLREDVFALTCADRSVTVKNISDKDISGGRVFYKNVSGNTLVGGITYMLNVPALSAGQETTLSAGHYMDGASRLMFVTYEQ